MTLQKINGGWMSNTDEKYKELLSKEPSLFGDTLYFIAWTDINPITGESKTSFHSYLGGGYGQCFSNEFDNAILFSSKAEAERLSGFLAGNTSVHHKIIKQTGVSCPSCAICKEADEWYKASNDYEATCPHCEAKIQYSELPEYAVKLIQDL